MNAKNSRLGKLIDKTLIKKDNKAENRVGRPVTYIKPIKKPIKNFNRFLEQVKEFN